MIQSVKFGGSLEMKKLIEVKFVYEDKSSESILDPRACLVFQSRCNSAGVISGIEDYIINNDEVAK